MPRNHQKLLRIIAIIAILFGTNFTNKAKAQVDVGDSLALVALYNFTDGTNWTNNTNWLVGPASTWFGVTVIGSRVSNLNLLGNNLIGIIPPEVGNLTNLTTLYLSENQLTGNIPAELGNLNNLADLSLYDNQLNGNLPVEIGNLSNLISLRLQNNSLNGSIPAELGNLINLQFLWLNANQLTGTIPVEFGNLTNLLQLYLSFNQLTGPIPVEFGNLTNLQFLDLVVNQLTGTIPVEFGDLANIQQLGLSSNQLIGTLPVEMGNLTNLQGLWLTSNQFTGSIPIEFVNLTLSNFSFENTSLCEPDNPSYSTWKSTVTNYLGTNIVCLPPGVVSQDSLALVSLYNSTSGPNWTNNTNWLLTEVEYWHGVAIDSNRVTILQLANNNLVGNIPSEIGDLTALNILWLGSNFGLAGNIPSEIGQLQKLDTLGLSYSGISGAIPETLYDISNLLRLSMSNTQLTGTLSPSVGKLTSLKHIALWNSPLTGDIPAEFWDMTWLENIYLGTNQQSGEISAKIGEFTNLNEFWISQSNLSGYIPSELGDASTTTLINLSDNRLNGAVPDEITNINSLKTFSIQNNNLNYLPDLTTLDSLQALSISNNKFTYADILPNQSLITDNTSQQPFGDSTVVQAYTFKGLRLDPSLEMIDGQQYQWFRDGTPLADGTSHYYEIADFREDNGGVYTLEVTHPDVNNFFLIRNPLAVMVNEGDPPKPQAVKVISPNGDGINDEMTIKNIELYPDHRVLIYDVIGRLVYETTKYDNINNPFIGVGNVNGFGELPAGTFYYLIDVGDTKKNGTGFFVMKRRR